MFEIMPFKKGSLAKKDFMPKFFDRIFDENITHPGWFAASFKVDIRETDDAYYMDAELPGYDKNAITITYDKNYLTINAKRSETVKEEKDNYIRQERSVGEIKRQFYVENIKEDNIEAEFTDGVLKLVLPKKEMTVGEKKTIPIK